MGIISFRALLCKSCPCGTSEEYSREQIEPFAEAYRLVRDEFRQEVQYGVYDEELETRDRVLVI
jgi:hypothetical protein